MDEGTLCTVTGYGETGRDEWYIDSGSSGRASAPGQRVREDVSQSLNEVHVLSMPQNVTMFCVTRNLTNTYVGSTP